MGLISDIKDKLAAAADEVEDRIDDRLDALKDSFDEESEAFWFKIEEHAPYVAFFVTSAAADLSQWYGENEERIERIAARLRDAAEDAYTDADGDLRDAANSFLNSDAFARAERRLDDLLDKAAALDLDTYLDDLFG